MTTSTHPASPPARTHTLVQITDTHLVNDGELLYGAVDTAANLQRAVDLIGDHAPAIDALLLTGDLANDGEAAAYQRLRGIVDAVAARLGVPVYYGMGNHDHREPFRAELLDGAPAPARTQPGGTATADEPELLAPVDYVVDVNGLRIVMVDSTVPGHHHGALTDEQLAWLERLLAVPASAGTILTIHHPPFPAPDDTPDAALLAAASFHSVDPLADVLRDSDVMMILSGHYHEPWAGHVGSVPVWAGPSTAMGHEFDAAGDRFRIVPNSGFSVINVYDNHTAIAKAINCLERPTLFEFTMAGLLELAAPGSH